MVRLISTAAVIVSSAVLIGCQTTNTGRGQIVPPQTAATSAALGPVNIAEATEADLVEQMAINRQAYHRGLELLVRYYTRTGNNEKLNWAKRELAALNSMPKYKYIVDAEVLPETLRATTLIPEADALYNEAVQLEKEAGPLPFAKNEDTLRLALDRYTQLMRKHPSSDKIDDAAFKAGGILEYFRDYTIALLYYQRAYQWDPQTPYPARFKAASILDRYLYQRAEALDLYRQAVKEERQFAEWVEFAERRIKELTKTEEGVR